MILAAFSAVAKGKTTKTDVNSINAMVLDILNIDKRLAASCADCVTHSPAISLSDSFFKDGADCRHFIEDNGEYGAWGKTIENYILTEPDGDVLLRDNLAGMESGSGGICPRWKSLNRDDKIRFWVWSMAAIAWRESTCVPTKKNRNATNGVGVGLFQLDERYSNRQWRGRHCKDKTVSAAKDNVECAMDIMSELMKGKSGMYKTKGILYGYKSGSYWEHLKHSDGGDIGSRIREFPLCQ
ncbi:transglycosylase SLT domain protein [Bacteriovorax sp. Seq25_V]|nr:transglycosylase SLT domain protein [Bacteriovorax sp. Seq25_V]